MRSIAAEQIDFSAAIPVTSAALKFVIPVGAFPDGDPLLYPEGSELAGRPVLNRDGSAPGAVGIVFFNAVDRRYQAAASDGRSVIIVNEVIRAQAEAIEDFVRRHGGVLGDFSKASLQQLLRYLASELDLIDFYNSTDDFVRSNLVPVGQAGTPPGSRPFGWMRRDGRDVCHAVFVPGPIQVIMPSAEVQRVSAPGAFVVRHGKEQRMVDAGVFVRTYQNLDGTRISLAGRLE